MVIDKGSKIQMSDGVYTVRAFPTKTQVELVSEDGKIRKLEISALEASLRFGLVKLV